MESLKKIALFGLLLILIISIAVPVAFAKPENPGPPDIQQRIFIHFAKPNPAKPKPPSGETGYYKLLGAKWKSFPVPIEVNPSNPDNLDETFVLTAIHTAAEEWDDGAYSNWGGVSPNLFEVSAIFSTKTYDDLAWTSDKLDHKNTIVWGNYPTSGVIAVTIVWYNVVTKTILEFDIIFDTDYAWGDATTNVMDLQNIATHELGHGAGLGDVYQSAAYRETMYGYSTWGETSKRDLYTGDKTGITKLYG